MLHPNSKVSVHESPVNSTRGQYRRTPRVGLLTESPDRTPIINSPINNIGTDSEIQVKLTVGTRATHRGERKVDMKKCKNCQNWFDL